MEEFRMSKECANALKKFNSAKSAMAAEETRYKEISANEAAKFALDNFGLKAGDKVLSRQYGHGCTIARFEVIFILGKPTVQVIVNGSPNQGLEKREMHFGEPLKDVRKES